MIQRKSKNVQDYGRHLDRVGFNPNPPDPKEPEVSVAPDVSKQLTVRGNEFLANEIQHLLSGFMGITMHINKMMQLLHQNFPSSPEPELRKALYALTQTDPKVVEFSPRTNSITVVKYGNPADTEDTDALGSRYTNPVTTGRSASQADKGRASPYARDLARRQIRVDTGESVTNEAVLGNQQFEQWWMVEAPADKNDENAKRLAWAAWKAGREKLSEELSHMRLQPQQRVA